MPPWIERPVIVLEADRAPAQRFEPIPREAVAAARSLLAAIGRQFPPQFAEIADAVRDRTRGRFHEEMLALAEMAGVTWREIAVANVSYDLRMAFGCSTVALPTATGPVLARNMDWWPEDELARASQLMRFESQGRLRFANAGWPGAVGIVTGLSGRGFAVALNAVHGPPNLDFAGYPVLLHLRRVIEEATDFDDAVETLRSTPLTTSALFTIVGTENEQRVVVERVPTRAALRWAEPDRPLATTNDFRLLDRNPADPAAGPLFDTACSRFDALLRAFRDHDPADPVTDARLLEVLTDSAVRLAITAQHIVMRPRTGAIRLFVPRHLIESSSGDDSAASAGTR